MTRKIIQLLLVLATVGGAAMALAHGNGSSAPDTSGHGSGNATSVRSPALHILQPSAGQVLADNFVTVRFELLRPNPAGGDNNFVIQLDSRDPVKTSETEYTFTGMSPGQHIIAVTEVDANGTPMQDARAEVHFSVKSPAGAAPAAPSGGKVDNSQQQH
jgi:hypothetical protein